MVRRYCRIDTAFVFLILLAGCTASNQQQADHGEFAHGFVNFPVSCAPDAQADLARAMILLHHMTYPQAREMFQDIADRHPDCAMAYWGVAMTLFQPLWPTRPGPADLKRGWEAMQKAVSLPPPGRREQLLIAAAEAFFRDPESADYWKRIRAWAEAMEQCYAAFPSDDEVAAFYALSLLAVVPPDRISSPNNARAADILLAILKRNPLHPGAMHYVIHANDVPGRERESRTVLRTYEAIAPENPHAIHMPTHINTRIGNWPEVIRGNIKAAAAALNFPAGDHGEFIWDEYPHALEYLIYACLQIGADDSAAVHLNRLHTTDRLEPTFKTAFHLAATKARYALERKAWDEAAGIVPRESKQVTWDKFAWPEAISWFARGLGSAHTGKTGEAIGALRRIEELEAGMMDAKEALFFRNIRVLRLELAAWVAHREGFRDSSVVVMRQAAELETATPKHAVTPGAILPAYELLGDLLLEQGRADEAFAAFKHALELTPFRFNSLLGAARAAASQDSLQIAGKYYRQLLTLVSPGSKRASISEAQAFAGH